jgi:hypothetical protein
VLRASEGLVFIPAPTPILGGLIDFVKKMWD